jgi:hypothetical protein
MNARVIIVFVLMLIALVALSLFSFGPLSRARKAAALNPASLQPVAAPPAAVAAPPVALQRYTNRDLRENHYSMDVPQTWQVSAGNAPGSYRMQLDGGEATVALQDVPDNTTLELFILSQAEPELKASATDYARTDYRKLAIHDAAAYELQYHAHGAVVDRTYVNGPDQAAVLTLTTPAVPAAALQETWAAVVRSFQWETK